MDAQKRLQGALDDALNSMSEGASTSRVVQAALRVAVLRQDLLAESWLRLEMSGIRPDGQKTDDLRPVLLRLSALIGPAEAEAQRVAATESLISRRSILRDNKPAVMAFGVAELEAYERSMRQVYDAPIQPGMTPIDTGLASINREKVRTQLGPSLLEAETILAHIRDAAYRYVLAVEGQILAGELTPDVIARGHTYVEEQLASIAPDALASLRSAQDRLEAGDEEALSHVATSCRRTLKALADNLYPAGEPVTDDAGVTRVMDDDHYRNRLTEYVRQRKRRSTHADLLTSNLAAFGSRLKSLDDLASKGVHGQVSRAEAESCLSWVYVLAADLLRVHQESDG